MNHKDSVLKAAASLNSTPYAIADEGSAKIGTAGENPPDLQGEHVTILVLFALAMGVPSAFAHAERGHVLDVSEENMKRIARSLGVRCTHCHIARRPDGRPDFEAQSTFKRTAVHMKFHFVDGLKTAEGKSLDCVSCHQGNARFLPRDLKGAKPSDMAERLPRREIFRMMKAIEKALGVNCEYCHVRRKDGRLAPEQPTRRKLVAKYMMDHYENALITSGGQPVTCATCHAGTAAFLPRSTVE